MEVEKRTEAFGLFLRDIEQGASLSSADQVRELNRIMDEMIRYLQERQAGISWEATITREVKSEKTVVVKDQIG